MSMQASLGSSRGRAIVSLVGAVLFMSGLFLPLFMQSNPQLPGSNHAIFEWQAVALDTVNPGLTVLLAALAILPLLSMLMVLGSSIAVLLGVSQPWLFAMRRMVAVYGLILQAVFEGLLYVIYGIGYARTDIGWGFAMMPIGFVVVVIGSFLPVDQGKMK